MGRQLFLVLAALCALLSWSLTEIFVQSQNNFLNNNQWILSKRLQQFGLTGADEFLASRDPLAGHTLDLGRWYGYQEVFTREFFPLDRAQLRIKVPENSYLDIALRNTEKVSFGFRLSQIRSSPSFSFRRDPSGAFLDKNEFPLAIPPHEVQLHISKEDLVLKERDNLVAKHKLPQNGSYQLVLTGGINGSLIKEVLIYKSDNLLFRDQFTGRKNWLLYFCTHFLILFSLSSFIAVTFKKINFNRAPLWVALVLIATFGASVPYYVFDRMIWSYRAFHFRETSLQKNQSHLLQSEKFENFRRDFFVGWGRLFGIKNPVDYNALPSDYPRIRFWEQPMLCRIHKPCEMISEPDWSTFLLPKRSGKRVVFLGGSQTFGSGAGRIEETFLNRLHEAQHRKIEFINLSYSAARMKDLQKTFDTVKKILSPDLVILNVGTNDIGRPEAETDARALLSSVHQASKQVLLVLETIDPDRGYSHPDHIEGMHRTHKMLRKIADELGIPSIGFYEEASTPRIRLSGNLWSDSYHLSPWGQFQFSEWLLKELDFSSIRKKKFLTKPR